MSKLQHLAAALAAVTVLALDIPAVPTWPSGRCTDKSLTIPSWIISNYTALGGTTTFRVDNRAADPNGRIADIQCTPQGDCQSSGNDELRGTISKGADGQTIVTLREIWVCGDAGDKVVFYASGSTTITQCTGMDCVSPIPYLVHGSLTLPVPLTPTQPSPPAGYNTSTCAHVGTGQWTVSGVSFRHYTMSQCKSWYIPDWVCIDPPWGYPLKGVHLNFTITNNGINHPVTCSFTPFPGIYVPPGPWRCIGGQFNEITLDVTWSGSAPNFNLKIEQLWYCLENPHTNVIPSVIVASGSTDLALACQSSPGITGNASDIITTCTDPVGSHLVAGTQNAKETLPAFSLVTAYPVQGGCTFDSVVNPTWYMRGLFFETTSFTTVNQSDATLSRFTCLLTGPGFADYDFYEGRIISGSGVSSVYDCNSYHDGKPPQEHWNCTYSFNPFSKVITLDKVWQCNDKNPTDILYFDGSGSFDWTKDPYYYCSSDNNLRCLWYDSLANLQPGIPYDIPKIVVGLVNVPPRSGESTIRVNGKWSKVHGE